MRSASARARIGSGRRLVVERRIGADAGQDAAVEHAAEDHPDPARRAGVEELGAAAVEQGVATGDQHAVEIDPVHEPRQHLALVHPASDRAHDPLIPQLEQRRERAVERFLLVVVGIVHEHHVEPVEPEAVQALLDRTQHAVAGVVELRGQPAGDTEDARIKVGVRSEQPSDLRRHHVRIPRVVAQSLAHSLSASPCP